MTVERIVAGLFDYAGLFPPAALDWQAMLREAAAFPTTLHRPALVGNDLVVRPHDLHRLDDERLQDAGFVAGRAVTACLVGVAQADCVDAAGTVAAWNAAHADDATPIRFTSLEVHGALDDGTATTLHAARAAIGPRVHVYFEPRWQEKDWLAHGRGLFAMLERLADAGPAVGLKLRFAGATKPSVPRLAAILARVNALGLPLKATQALHHPFAADERHGNEHGFLNVAVALRLQAALGLDASVVADVLRDDDPSSFVFDAGLGWRDHRAAWQRVAEARAVPFAIGSCSLAEPDDDLRDLFG
jgi:hypothetical protein